MKDKPCPEVATNLAALRRRRGFSAAALARNCAVSRQTIYAIEAGTFVPNTAVALRLAAALEVTVEDLFTLPANSPAPDLPAAEAALLPDSAPLLPGQPVELCRVGKRLFASSPFPASCWLPASDAVVAAKPAAGKVKVRLHRASGDLKNRLLVAGCDPGISILARHARAAGIELVSAHRNSSQALALLKQGAVHVAGTHLRDPTTGESNLPHIARLFPKNAVAVVSFATWEEGIVVAPGNPKRLRGIADFTRRDILIVNREKGAGSRLLLDAHLARLKIEPKQVRGYRHAAAGHLSAAAQVLSGAADCCIATLPAARLFGLGFIPLVNERYDFAVRRSHLELPAIQTFFDTLNRANFRRELLSLGGYDTAATGRRLL